MLYNAGKENLNPVNIVRWIKYKIDFAKAHPHYFRADGLLMFTGAQGSGKTLSAVNYVYKLMERFPHCKLVTNLRLIDYPVITYENFLELFVDDTRYLDLTNDADVAELIAETLMEFYKDNNRVFPFISNDSLMEYNNGEFGVIFLVDEIQLYAGSLESKNINPAVMTEISQQRKQRKHIVATSQVFGRVAKPLREQFSDVIYCRNILGVFQMNLLIDRDSMEGESSTETSLTGKVKKKFYWFHTPEMYSRYDTYVKLKRNEFVAGERVVMMDYGNNTSND